MIGHENGTWVEKNRSEQNRKGPFWFGENFLKVIRNYRGLERVSMRALITGAIVIHCQALK